MAYRQTTRMLAAVWVGWAAAAAAPALAAQPSYETIRDLVYVSRGDEPLRADVYRPTGEGPFPGVLCVHGGAWMIGNKSHFAGIARQLAQAGYVAVAINYRLAPKHKFPAQIEDCRAALAWIQKHGKDLKIDTKRLGAWGYSAGGHLVALLATSGKGLRAEVAGGAPSDFRDMSLDNPRLAFWLGGTRRELPEVYRRASPAYFVSPDDPPMFFYHAKGDRVVSVEHATEMMAHLKRAGVTAKLYLVPDQGSLSHVRAYTNQTAVTEGIKFLDEYLAASRPD